MAELPVIHPESQDADGHRRLRYWESARRLMIFAHIHVTRLARRTRKAIVLSALLALSSMLCAERPSPPTLEQILQRLETNLHRYDTTVPSFFCDEHAISAVWPGAPNENRITDSVFRLTRTPQPDHTTTLVESRDIQKVDGKPATERNVDGPTLLRGAFEGGLAVVSLSQSACMSYSLQPIRKSHPIKPYIIYFATDGAPRNRANCLLQENSTGRAFIDPASMQIKHLEITTPRHVIDRGDYDTPDLVGKRVLTVDYSPVTLGGQTFWMPSAINMRVTSGTFHMTVWSFQAKYRNYHKLEVTSRIVPGSESRVP
ncbi:MAG TPA: hypothetical protein VJU82_10285 [Acidobacteriaceae bacterium]|nr:hypothetical protein [Acidobacteriaceae bacterium]